MSIISIELVSKVLGLKSIYRIINYADNNGINVQAREFGSWEKYNIHELAHKCKEWAFDNGIMFDVRWHTNRKPFKISIMVYGNHSRFFVEDTEPEAVIKMCQWILDDMKGEASEKVLRYGL